VSTGISRLDESLGGKGFYRGASILVSGDAGTGKSSLAAHFVNAACARGERALYMTSEQSASEVIRNMHSIGIRLEPWIQRGLLRIYAARPGSFGLEQHLVTIHDITAAFSPKVVVIDPITNFPSTGAHSEVNSMVTRLIDIFKARQITGMYTSLTSAGDWSELSRVGVSSLMDTCLMLRNLECNGERNRGLHVLKSRGTAHSNQIREFVLSDHGLQLLDVYLGSSRSLTGSARVAQEAKEQMESEESKWQAAQMEFETEQEHQRLELQISKMRADFEFNERQSLRHARAMESRDKKIASNRVEMANSQRVEVVPSLSNWRARKQGAVSRFAKA
jgi:circadian clock protein KaiC